MAIPKYNEFFPPFLTYLADGKAHTVKEIRAYCADSFNLSDEERNATISSGRNLLIDRVGWAKTHLKKAGLIDTPARASCVITNLGKQVLVKGADCLTLDYVHQLQEENGDALPIPTTLSSDTDASRIQEVQSPLEAIDIALAQLKSELADELLSEVLKMDEYDFEKLVVDLLVKMGYDDSRRNYPLPF